MRTRTARSWSSSATREIQGAVRDAGVQRQLEPRDGSMWPIAFALTKLTKADEARIAKLVKQAVS